MEKNDQAQSGARGVPPSNPSPSSQAPRPRRIWPWVVAVIIVLLVVLVIFVRRGQPNAQTGRGGRGGAGQTVMIDTATAQKGDIGVYVNALGTVTPYYVVSVRTRVDGELTKVYYKEGQLVHAGDPLVDIDASPFQATLVQSQGQLARDQALLENARLDLSRYQEAFSKNAVPKQQLDTQGSVVHQYEGTVMLDEGSVSNALVQLAYCHITSPITGRVGLRLMDPGNIVHASDANPLVVVTELQPITVVFSIAEDSLQPILRQMRQGKQLAADALDRSAQDKIASGVLESLNNQIDTNTGTVQLKAMFTNEDESLFPNQFVNIKLLVDTHRDVTLLPNPVIQHNSQGAYVYLVQSTETNQVAVIKTINVVTSEGDVSEVEGIEPGAVVAASNFNRLTDGATVSVRAAGEGKQRGGAMTNAPEEDGTNAAVESGTNRPAKRGKKK
ncbi:MAG TPA: efflux RND transporter periplasmic adaptor subunit [Verrucomicrobiae bacterium]|jgi:multidrug efflux system membrane fusion protein|nr:efflux RND transporter periplasmic adaptor subunit [Verrucomicrobiae bacterium]